LDEAEPSRERAWLHRVAAVPVFIAEAWIGGVLIIDRVTGVLQSNHCVEEVIRWQTEQAG
jgi:hypothetical protein